jgi:hypothetical protein
MQVNKENLASAIRALVLRDVYFRNERIALREDITPPFLPEAWRVQFKMLTRILHDFETGSSTENPGETGESNRFLEVEFTGGVRCFEGDDADALGAELLEMEVAVGLLYQVTGECADECLEEFVKVNVAYHAIPYWRENVHAVCAKRRFPPITVPMYKAMAANDPEVRRSEAESSE